MVRARASRIAARAAIVAALILTTVVPAAAAAPDVRVITTASPTSVTIGKVVAYPVTVTNMSTRTLNFVDLTGSTTVPLAYLGSLPLGACSQTQATCTFGTMRAGESRSVTFYYRAPSAAGSFTFTATVRVAEGDIDSGGSQNQDTFTQPVITDVLAILPDLVRGHAFGVQADRTFTTGLTTLGTGNPHGTTVRIPSATVEVTAADLPPGPAIECPPALTTCFGWGSSLNVGAGGLIPGGIEVTTRWDASELPNGMTAKKLRVAHLLSATQFQQITGICAFVGGVPTNMPCFSTPPFQLSDKDIQATYWLAFNRVTRGY